MTDQPSIGSSLPVGVCVLPPPPANAPRTCAYPEYVHEILAHAGLCYAPVALDELAERLDTLRILVTVGEAALPEGMAERLRAWVARGGAWVAVAGACGQADLFGVRVERPAYALWAAGLPTLGEGYLQPIAGSPLTAHLRIPLHYFNGLPVQPADSSPISQPSSLATCLDAHARPKNRVALAERETGAGRCILIAPDLTGAVVRIQQGVAVTRDGVPSSDGTAPTSDGVLKSDDGAVLDWLLDREQVPGVPGFRAFLQPVADQWRELLVRAILHAAQRQGLALPLLWLYPRNLSALATMSHDTDGNDPALGRALLELVDSLGIKTTWCTILPGYDPQLMRDIQASDHELAMHYDAISEGLAWGEAEFDRQWRALTELFGGEPPVTNKNHYLRWEGDAALWEWCAARGIELDQSKGASKTGEAGFNFGTCHPYFPVAPGGAKLDVLELPTPTQDLTVFAPTELLLPLVETAARHHGVLHLLFHPAHVAKPGVAEAIRAAVEQGRAAGMEWWTAAALNRWERARRAARWIGADDEGCIRLRAGADLPGATLLWLDPDGDTERWGFRFRALQVELAAAQEYAIRPDGAEADDAGGTGLPRR